MSRQNKVNPGRYTQRGRLTQDDAARELRKQSLMASPNTWQPVDTRTGPLQAPAGDATRQSEASPDKGTMAEASPKVERRPASRVTRKKRVTKSAPSIAGAKAAKAKRTTTRKSKTTTRRIKTVGTRTGRTKTGRTKRGTAATRAIGRRTTRTSR
jgi:hypothetical protein